MAMRRGYRFIAAVGVVVILLLVINTRPRVHVFNSIPTAVTSRDAAAAIGTVEDIIYVEDITYVGTTTNGDTEPVEDLLGLEVQKILNRVDRCLEATNMSRDFKRTGYDIAARDHAEQFIRMLRTVIPRNFSSKYSSPCWETDFQVSVKGTEFVESKVGDTTFLSKPVIYSNFYSQTIGLLKKAPNGVFKSSVVCLPKILQMGVAKSGTTFLYCLMTEGLGRKPVQMRKELHWWERWPTQIPQADNIPVNLLYYAQAYKMIAAGHHDVVTIDGSPNYFDTYIQYYNTEPPVNYCLLPAIIPEVLPDSKFVIVLRNPLTMIYATFLYTCNGHSMGSNSPNIFHERIMTKLNQFHNCLQHYSIDWCVLNITYDIYTPEFRCGRTRIDLAMYYIHIRRWLSVASRERFLFLTMEEISKNTKEVGKQLWEFMGYAGNYKSVSVLPCQRYFNRNNHQNDPRLRMRKDTEQILKNFFQPYNQMLADLLGDSKFLWNDS